MHVAFRCGGPPHDVSLVIVSYSHEHVKVSWVGARRDEGVEVQHDSFPRGAIKAALSRLVTVFPGGVFLPKRCAASPSKESSCRVSSRTGSANHLGAVIDRMLRARSTGEISFDGAKVPHPVLPGPEESVKELVAAQVRPTDNFHPGC
jgi:hypothetical protein